MNATLLEQCRYLIPILFVSTGTALADSQAFTTGFQTGFTNQSESQCDAYGNATDVAFDEHHCRAGFDQGQLKLMQSTPQYKIGLMAGRHDSTIANSTGDAHECNIYATIFQYNSCTKGFDTAYHYTYKGPLPIMAQPPFIVMLIITRRIPATTWAKMME